MTTPLQAATVDVVHVAASEGRSLGGHAALRLGDVVYHFQHRAGLLVLEREAEAAFRWRYGVLQNRNMRMLHLDLADGAVEALREHLNGRYLMQRQHLALHEAHERDRALLTAWAKGTAAPEGIAVPGAAAFFDDGDTLDAHDADLGPGVARALDDVRRTIAGLAPNPVPSAPAQLAPGVYLPVSSRLSERYEDLVERVVALDVLSRGRRVRPARLVRVPDDDAAPLTTAERTTLVRWRNRLRRTVDRLPRSARPDWGLPLLVTLARLQAIDASLAAGRLVVVVAPETDGAPIDTRHRGGRAFAREVAARARATLRHVRVETIGANPHDLTEQEWARLEDAALRVATSAHWNRPDAMVRLGPDDATPTGAVRLRGLPRPALPPGQAAGAAAEAARIARDSARALREAYGYDLIERNCVTELVRVVAASLPADGEAVGVDGLGFVPTVSFDRLVATQHLARTSQLPSYRRRRLAAMRTAEPALLVRLREDNVLTSSLYRGGGGNPAFAFFTDDAVFPRPLYGIANLAVGLAQTGTGLVTAPFDHARTLRQGLQGMLVSVPELAFVSLRTGTMLHADDGDPQGAP